MIWRNQTDEMDDMSNSSDEPRRPSGAAAVSAGVLALLGSVAWAFITWRGVVSVLHRSDPDRIVPHPHDSGFDYYPAGIWIGWTPLTEAVVATVLLLTGGVLILMRKRVARWLILVGCIAAFANVIHPLVADDYWYSSFSGWDLIHVALAVITAALAFLSTVEF